MLNLGSKWREKLKLKKKRVKLSEKSRTLMTI
jgi:hypothetical protein